MILYGPSWVFAGKGMSVANGSVLETPVRQSTPCRLLSQVGVTSGKDYRE